MGIYCKANLSRTREVERPRRSACQYHESQVFLSIPRRLSLSPAFLSLPFLCPSQVLTASNLVICTAGLNLTALEPGKPGPKTLSPGDGALAGSWPCLKILQVQTQAPGQPASPGFHWQRLWVVGLIRNQYQSSSNNYTVLQQLLKWEGQIQQHGVRHARAGRSVTYSLNQMPVGEVRCWRVYKLTSL